jgi:maltose alpha-D-glucosyltransferase/alpha-amylase
VDDRWYKDALIYELSVRTFADSNGDGVGDFRGLSRRLDYLAALGVTAIWLSPFYESPWRDDGYDVTDFYRVHPDFGDVGDFVRFVERADDRGIRVLIDLVLNHTSDEHPWFQAARAGDPKYRDFYVWADERPDDAESGIVFPGVQTTTWSYDRKARRYYFHRFYDFQPDLNIDNPEVRDELMKVIGYWAQLGIAGYRVDAVPFLIEPAGLPEGAIHDPHELLRDLRAYLNRRDGEAVLLGEVNLPADQQRAFLGDEDGDELHMVLDFLGNQALYLALARGEAEPLARALRAFPELPQTASLGRFVRNHDELTLDKLSEDERNEVFARFGPDPGMQLYGRGIRRRLPTMLGGDERAMRMVYSLAFSLPGTPVLFYGEEIGMGENLDIDGRYSVRSPMQWSAERHGGFSTVEDPARLRRPLTSGEYGPERVNVTAQRRDPHSLLSWVERLIRRRRESPELGFGALELLETGAPSVLAHVGEDVGAGVQGAVAAVLQRGLGPAQGEQRAVELQ